MIVIDPPKAEQVQNIHAAALEGLNAFVMIDDDRRHPFLCIAIPCNVPIAKHLAAQLKREE